MRIGELAQASGMADKTIRYYESVGVMDPPRRTPNGYREYDSSALERLRFVRSAQAVGLSLGEIREIVELRERGRAPCAHVTELLQRRAAEIEDRIAELDRMRTEVRRLARRARSLDPRLCDPTRICHVIEPAPSP